MSSGSDQRRSHMGPSWGTSCFRSIVLKLKVWDRATYFYRRHSDWGRQTWSGRESGWRDSSHRGHRRSCRRWWRTRRGSRRSLCSTSTPASQSELAHIYLINALILTKGYLWEGILKKNIQYRNAAVLAQTLVIEPINLVDRINFCNVVIQVLIQTCVIWRDSWFPLIKVIRSG